jgi:hypothetical protein
MSLESKAESTYASLGDYVERKSAEQAKIKVKLEIDSYV